jgi:hypothetical protein
MQRLLQNYGECSPPTPPTNKLTFAGTEFRGVSILFKEKTQREHLKLKVEKASITIH